MEDYLIRPATLNDIDFLVETIIEAEKSGTEILSYSTLFGLSESDTKIYIAKMLEEEVDDCDFSVSGFLIAEKNGEPAAALNAWVEGINGISAATIKGNLFNYYFPKESMQQAKRLIPVISDLSIHYIPGSLWLGYGYVAPKHRGCLLLVRLCQHHIRNMIRKYPEIKEIYCPMFATNIASIQNFRLLRFQIIKEYSSKAEEINSLLPANRKVLMKKSI